MAYDFIKKERKKERKRPMIYPAKNMADMHTKKRKVQFNCVRLWYYYPHHICNDVRRWTFLDPFLFKFHTGMISNKWTGFLSSNKQVRAEGCPTEISTIVNNDFEFQLNITKKIKIVILSELFYRVQIANYKLDTVSHVS